MHNKEPEVEPETELVIEPEMGPEAMHETEPEIYPCIKPETGVDVEYDPEQELANVFKVESEQIWMLKQMNTLSQP